MENVLCLSHSLDFTPFLKTLHWPLLYLVSINLKLHICRGRLFETNGLSVAFHYSYLLFRRQLKDGWAITVISSALSSYLWYLSFSLLLNILFSLVKEILAPSVSSRLLIGRMAGHPGTHEWVFWAVRCKWSWGGGPSWCLRTFFAWVLWEQVEDKGGTRDLGKCKSAAGRDSGSWDSC